MNSIVMSIKTFPLKKIMAALAACTILVACATPKYIYYFSTYTTQSTAMVKKKDAAGTAADSIPCTDKISVDHFPFAIQKETVVGSTSNEPVVKTNNDVSVFSKSSGTTASTRAMTDEKETVKKLQAFKKIKNPEQSNPKEGDKKKNGSAVIGFILSLFSWFIFLAPFAILFCVIGMKSEKRKLAKAGLILTLIGIIIFTILLIFVMG